MTDEELQKEILKVNESLDKLPKADKSLTKQEARHKQVLLLEKETLYEIKEAKAMHNLNQEVYHAVLYNLLTSWGEKHPFLIPFLLRITASTLRWDSF